MRKFLLFIILMLLFSLPAQAEDSNALTAFDGDWELTYPSFLKHQIHNMTISDGMLTLYQYFEYPLQYIDGRVCVQINNISYSIALDDNDQLYLFNESNEYALYRRQDAAPASVPELSVSSLPTESLTGDWFATTLICERIPIDLTLFSYAPIFRIPPTQEAVITLDAKWNIAPNSVILPTSVQPELMGMLDDGQLVLSYKLTVDDYDYSAILLLTHTNTTALFDRLSPLEGTWYLQQVEIGPIILPADMTDQVSELIIKPYGIADLSDTDAAILSFSNNAGSLLASDGAFYEFSFLGDQLILEGSNETTFLYTREDPTLIGACKGRWLLTEYTVYTPYINADIVSEVPTVLEITSDSAVLSGDFGRIDLLMIPDFANQELRLSDGHFTLIMETSGDYRELEDEADNLCIDIELIK